jgi:hypothetical protein
LLGEKEFISRDKTVAISVVRGAALQFDKLIHCFALAGCTHSKRGCVSVRLRILSEVFEARVTIPGAPGGFGIHFLQVAMTASAELCRL